LHSRKKCTKYKPHKTINKVKFEKFFYVIISTILITAFVLVSYITFPLNIQRGENSTAKRIYYVDHISNAHRIIIKKFNEKYKGQIEVEPINLPFDKFSTNERKELLARFLRSKSDRIDILAVDQIWVPRFARWGIPLDKYVDKEQRSNLINYAKLSCIYDGQLIAVPVYLDMALMYYRKDLLKVLPDYPRIKQKLDNSITWEDFIALHKRLNDKTRPFFIFQGNDFEGLMCIFVEMLASQNSLFATGDSLHINTPEARKALTLLVDMVNRYNISPREVTKFKEKQSYSYFINNNGYFLRGWPSFLNDYKSASGNSYICNNLEKAPVPHFEGGRPAAVYGGWNLVISKYSTKVAESVVFINYLLSEESQKTLYEEGGYLPISRKLYDDSLFITAHPEFMFYKTNLANGIYRPFSEKYTVISDVVSYYLNLALKNKMTVAGALQRAEEKYYSKSILLK